MLILTIRSDKPEAELGLYDDDQQLAYEIWEAHRQLAETIHLKIKGLLNSQQKTLQNVEGIVAFQGPGSFTGLRIGLTVANALADSLKVPIVAAQTEAWVQIGINRLQSGENQALIVPEYGALPNITKPKH
jgi:tRNA threonylcarbamoyladenosine biosynthesis protein TsaB